MSEIIDFLFGYTVPIVVVLVAFAAALGAMSAEKTCPRCMVRVGCLVALMVFPMSPSYGVDDAANVSSGLLGILSVYRAHAPQLGEMTP